MKIMAVKKSRNLLFVQLRPHRYNADKLIIRLNLRTFSGLIAAKFQAELLTIRIRFFFRQGNTDGRKFTCFFPDL